MVAPVGEACIEEDDVRALRPTDAPRVRLEGALEPPMHRILIVLALGVCELVCDCRLVNVDAAAVSLQETSSISTAQHSGGNCSCEAPRRSTAHLALIRCCSAVEAGHAQLLYLALCWRGWWLRPR